MFEALQPTMADPILGLMASFQRDSNPSKVDLGVGVYKDESGCTPVMGAVKAAEARLLETQASKAYVGPSGDEVFNGMMSELLLGSGGTGERVVAVQTPGGCGALRAGAELIRRSRADCTVWVSNPTWANHLPLLGSAALRIREYPYYDDVRKRVDFDAMMGALAQAESGDVVLLHGCCHNPCGADLGPAQWLAVGELLQERGLVPFIDVAYQGLGQGLEADVEGVRLVFDAVPEMLIASSCSKNFGLYRERTGALIVVTEAALQTAAVASQICSVVRGMWSMPPDHGASIVTSILADPVLHDQWASELTVMRNRINQLRRDLVLGLDRAGAGDFGFIAREHGMFSFLGLSEPQVERLRTEFSLYMVGSSRINVAGLNAANLDYACASVAAVCR